MKRLTHALFPLIASLAYVGELQAAVTTFDGLAFETLLTSIPGWRASETNSLSHLIAWVEDDNGAFGGAYVPGSATPVSLTMTSSLYSSIASVSMDIALYDSSVEEPGRDTFSVTLTNGTGATLVSLFFSPAVSVGGQARWEVGYSVGTGDIIYTGRTLSPGPAYYDVSVDFEGADFVFTFGNSLGSFSYDGTIAGYDGATAGLGDISFVWTKSATEAYGSNFITFDNISVVVPEPASLMLSTMATAFFLIRRRR